MLTEVLVQKADRMSDKPSAPGHDVPTPFKIKGVKSVCSNYDCMTMVIPSAGPHPRTSIRS